eukprot:5472592-Pleurochrysis_carterae.AAC.6
MLKDEVSKQRHNQQDTLQAKGHDVNISAGSIMRCVIICSFARRRWHSKTGLEAGDTVVNQA